ncbi:MAG TPA: CoA transferase [Candidatus Limnocylindrales bacterium]
MRVMVRAAMVGDKQRRAGALAGIRVLDLADELGAYASRLLGDLGADVIRIEPPGGGSTRHIAPIVVLPGAEPAVAAGSAFDRFVNAGKRSVTLDIRTDDGHALFERLLRTADILIETWSFAEADAMALRPADISAINPNLVHVSVSPFGRDRARDPVADDDLTIMAAGGLLNLGGYPDSAPLVAAGGQSRNAASLFAAVGALVGLLDRARAGRGRWIDVSAQECVAQGLEDTVAAFEMTGKVRKRHGSNAAEAGTGMYPCADGLVSMVAGRVGTARAWQALIDWLVEAGADGADALQEPAWAELSHRQTKGAIEQFSRVFGAFARARTRQELYREAQARGIALSPVNDLAGVLADPQLRARGFWATVVDPETRIATEYPGPPYRLSRTPATPARPAPAAGANTTEVLTAELGLTGPQVEELCEAGVT